MNKLYEIWDAGNVSRWHANKYPQLRNSHDTVHAHSARVGLLMWKLFGLPPEGSLFHDLPEKKLGDIPYGAPKGHHYEDAESEWFIDHGMVPIESPQLHFCDRLDALLWGMQHVPNILRDPEWDAAYERILKQAHSLAVYKEVAGLLDDAKQMCNVVSAQ